MTPPTPADTISRRPLRVGLTGGIGSGKSTVGRLLRLFGIPVYDADQGARRLMEHNPTLRTAIVDLFGSEAYLTVGDDLRLNRPYIASRAFGHPDRLEALNRLVHPAVARDFADWAERWEDTPYVVEEAAVLIESGAAEQMDRVVTVTAPEEIRIQRIIARDHTIESAARARIAAQLSDAQRAPYADFVLTADDRSLLIPQVVALHAALCRESGRN